MRVGNNRPDLGNNPLCNRYHGFIEEGKPLFLPCTRPAPGAFVSIHLESPSGSALSICETFIYTDHGKCRHLLSTGGSLNPSEPPPGWRHLLA